MENDKGRDKSARESIKRQDIFHRAFYPLTLPLTVGPGSTPVAITLGANAAHGHALHPLTILTALVGFALIAFSIFLCYGFAGRLARMLGRTAMTVITKLSSFLLVCIGVQIGWNGIKELLVCGPASGLTGRNCRLGQRKPTTTQGGGRCNRE